MPLAKKPPSAKRTNPPRASDCARQFMKDWERLTRSGRYDMVRLKEVMLLLIANDAPLAAEWLDHPLQGNYEGYRECHIGGDFLLIYKVEDVGWGRIGFTRVGTHSELFG